MEYRRCGASNLRLSALGLGCWAFGGGDYWGPQDQQEVNRIVRRAVELGVTYFDTAEAYNGGRSESALGEATRGLPRERLILGTKLSPSNATPAAVVEHCDASLKRLGTDYLDVYMVHWPILRHSVVHFHANECPAPDEAFAALIKLQYAGKVRHLGVSNFGVETLEQARDCGAEIVVNELPYNLLARAIEGEILPHCRAAGVGVIGYMALMQGLLADIYPTLEDVPLWQRRTRHFHPARAGELCRHGCDGAEAETNAAIAEIRRIARAYGRSMADVAIQWALAGEGVCCVLAGARSVAELEANVRAAEQTLTPACKVELDRASAPLWAKLGDSFDYYEHPDNDRTRPLPARQPPAFPPVAASPRR